MRITHFKTKKTRGKCQQECYSRSKSSWFKPVAMQMEFAKARNRAGVFHYFLSKHKGTPKPPRPSKAG